MVRINWSLTPVFAQALLLAACSVVDPNNMIGRQMGEATPLPTEFVSSPPPATMRAEDRRRAFDFVWRTINDRYYNEKLNGVDWNAIGERYRPIALAAGDDDAFWDTLDRMAGELRDAHTRVESPRRVALRMRDESVTLGFTFIPTDGKLAITGVNPDSDAWWAGVRPGMTLAMIGSEPADAAYERLTSETRLDSTDRARRMRALRRLITGEPGTSATFTFERADGTRFDAKLTRRRVVTRAAESHRVLPSGYGYIRFNEWTLSVTARAIEGLDSLKATPGLVIDLRGNPGGAMFAVNQMLERFFPSRTEVGRVLTRNGRPITLMMGAFEVIKLAQVVPGNPDAYKGPVVVLVNSGSASGSELFAGAMQATGRAEVIGQPSCGCLLGFLGYARIPGGGALAYSEIGFVLGNGKHIEGEGVIPDRAVPLTIPDLQVSRDRTLEEAQALLATMKPWDK